MIIIGANDSCLETCNLSNLALHLSSSSGLMISRHNPERYSFALSYSSSENLLLFYWGISIFWIFIELACSLEGFLGLLEYLLFLASQLSDTLSNLDLLPPLLTLLALVPGELVIWLWASKSDLALLGGFPAVVWLVIAIKCSLKALALSCCSKVSKKGFSQMDIFLESILFVKSKFFSLFQS